MIILRMMVYILKCILRDTLEITIKHTKYTFGLYKDLCKLKKQMGQDNAFQWAGYYLLNEKFEEAGTMKGAYFHQDLYVAKQIYKNNPEKHLDIGSRIDGFVSHVATYRDIEIMDIRPQFSKVERITFRQADLMNLPKNMTHYCDSISSLHAIEHFGLGRYGDPIDYHGHEKAINNITEILKPNGIFYLSVPIGIQRIEFNAHRIFSVQYLIDLLQPKYEILTFSYVDSQGDLHENVSLREEAVSRNCEGCGIFVLRKV